MDRASPNPPPAPNCGGQAASPPNASSRKAQTDKDREALIAILGESGRTYFARRGDRVRRFMTELQTRGMTLEQPQGVRDLFRSLASPSGRAGPSLSERRSTADSNSSNTSTSALSIPRSVLSAGLVAHLKLIFARNPSFSQLSDAVKAVFVDALLDEGVDPQDLQAVRDRFRIFLSVRSRAAEEGSLPKVPAARPPGMTRLVHAVCLGEPKLLNHLLALGEDPARCSFFPADIVLPTPKQNPAPKDQPARPEQALQTPEQFLETSIDSFLKAPRQSGSQPPGQSHPAEDFLNETLFVMFPHLKSGLTRSFQVAGCNALTAAVVIAADHEANSEGRRNAIEMMVLLSNLINAANGQRLIEQFDDREETPLTTAILFADLEIVVLLLDLGADPARPNGRGESPLACSIAKGNLEIEKILHQRGGRPIDGHSCTTPLHTAVRNGNLEAIDLLLQQSAPHSELDAKGWTPLHHALDLGDAAIVAKLLKAGADPFGVGSEPPAPILLACANVDLASLFLPYLVARAPHVLRLVNLDRNHGSNSKNYKVFATCTDHLAHKMKMGAAPDANAEEIELARLALSAQTQLLKSATAHVNAIDLFELARLLGRIDKKTRTDAIVRAISDLPTYLEEIFSEGGRKERRSRCIFRFVEIVDGLNGRGKSILSSFPEKKAEFAACSVKCLEVASRCCRIGDYSIVMDCVDKNAEPLELRQKLFAVMLSRLNSDRFGSLTGVIGSWSSSANTEKRFPQLVADIANLCLQPALAKPAREALSTLWAQAFAALSPEQFAMVPSMACSLSPAAAAWNLGALRDLFSVWLDAAAAQPTMEPGLFKKLLCLHMNLVEGQASAPDLRLGRLFCGQSAERIASITANLALSETACLLSLPWQYPSEAKNRLAARLAQTIFSASLTDGGPPLRVEELRRLLRECLLRRAPFFAGFAEPIKEAFAEALLRLSQSQRKSLLAGFAEREIRDLGNYLPEFR